MRKKEYKQNWEETRERFAVWWERRDVERPLLNVTAPKFSNSGSSPSGVTGVYEKVAKKDRTDIEKNWLDISGVLDQMEKTFEQTAYLGDAFPYVMAYLGPGSLGTFMGAIPRFRTDTVWYESHFQNIDEVELSLKRSSKWWRWSIDFTTIAARQCSGNYLVAIPDLIENLDTLAALVGPDKLLFYLMDAPLEIHRLQRQLLSLWSEAFDEHYRIVSDSNGWNSFSFDIWGPGKTAKLQCDFSAMISPAMFGEFVLPYLREQSDGLDHTLYHMDGPGALCHLDALLTIDSLDCINWSPGPGQPDAGDPYWDPTYRKILDAGKGIHVQMDASLIRDFLKRLGRKGVFVTTRTSTVQEGKELVDSSIRW